MWRFSSRAITLQTYTDENAPRNVPSSAGSNRIMPEGKFLAVNNAHLYAPISIYLRLPSHPRYDFSGEAGLRVLFAFSGKSIPGADCSLNLRGTGLSLHYSRSAYCDLRAGRSSRRQTPCEEQFTYASVAISDFGFRTYLDDIERNSADFAMSFLVLNPHSAIRQPQSSLRWRNHIRGWAPFCE